MHEEHEQQLDEGPGSGIENRLSRATAWIAVRLVGLLGELLPATSAMAEHREALDEICRDVLGEELEEGAERDRRRTSGAEQPIARLTKGLALSSFEVDLLLLSGLAEEHEAFAALLRSLHPRGEPRPTAALAAKLFCRSTEERTFLREALEAGPLAATGAVALSLDVPFFERSLLLAEALWSALHGFEVWPAGITRRVERPISLGLTPWLSSGPAVLAAEALRRAEPRTIVLSADDDEIALHRAVALADSAGVPAAVLEWDSRTRQLERLASLHAVVRGVVPIVKSTPRDGTESWPMLAEHPGPLVLCSRTGSAGIQGKRPVLSVPIGPLSATSRRQVWAAALPELSHEATRLSARFALEPAAAVAVAADVRGLRALSRREATLDDVAASVRARSALAVTPSVKLVHANARFSQLVLRDGRITQLREAIGRLQGQARVLDDWGFLAGRPGARGVRMLFSGPPGTGKTLSAEVLATELGVDLLVIDLSRVVSKWLGETEKNLSDVFDAAERSHAVLLFDEADALFGNRTSVSDAHDRYANLETAYLLSRLERFEGLTILATNLRQNVDPAFLRRIEFVLDFEEPGSAEREALWRCHLPKSAPLASDVDVAELAALYPIVGGLIKNAAVAAAFLAAGDSTRIERRHFLRAIRREYEKAGRAFPGPPPE